MKRFMMQMMRTMVTVIVVGTMAMMIFSLRGELAEAKAKAAAAGKSGEPGLFETIAARTSIRKFDPSKPVSDADIEKILKAGMCAPSAMDRRPWEFIVAAEQSWIQYSLPRPGSPLSRLPQTTIAACAPFPQRE